MPEGDTIHRLASQLSRDIREHTLVRLWLRDRGEVHALAGARVAEVSALGKHLLIRFAQPADAPVERGNEEWILHTHLGMPGRWHRGPPVLPQTVPHSAHAPRRDRVTPSARLEFEAAPSWVCTRPARCELFPRSVLGAHPVLRRLGPDLLAAPVPHDAILRRARHSRAPTLAELLLDQRVACGLGNVYKSELLFLHGLSPEREVAATKDETLEALFRDGARLLAKNIGPGRRRTRAFGNPERSEPRFWVYDRAGRPCLRCAAPIEVLRFGEGARITYYCRGCQHRTTRRGADSASATLRRAASRGTGMGPRGRSIWRPDPEPS